MKKGFSLFLLGCGSVLFFAAGCSPELAQVPVGQEEKEWDKVLKDNYYSFVPPRTPAPAAYQPPQTPAVKQEFVKSPADPQEDPAAIVDRAASGDIPATPAAKEQKTPVKEVKAAAEKKEGAKEVKAAEEKKADPAAAKAALSGKYSKPYIVERGDTLGKIALRFYGKSSMEEVIFKANSKVITDRNKLRPGMKLVIPEL